MQKPETVLFHGLKFLKMRKIGTPQQPWRPSKHEKRPKTKKA